MVLQPEREHVAVYGCPRCWSPVAWGLNMQGDLGAEIHRDPSGRNCYGGGQPVTTDAYQPPGLRLRIKRVTWWGVRWLFS